MATYKGVKGVQELADSIHDKLRSVVARSGSAIALELIETSEQVGAIGAESYPTKVGEVYNEVGDYINNWHVSTTVRSNLNPPDPLASDARIDAIEFERSYELGKSVYIYNTVEYAENVEEGWPEMPELGWKSREGYNVFGIVAENVDEILVKVATSVSKGEVVDDGSDVPF